MSTLLIEVLDTDATLTQEYDFNLNKRHQVQGFYPYIAMVNAPAGTFTFSVQRDSLTVFQKSFTAQDLKDSLGTTDDHLHVWFPILPSTQMILTKGKYSFKISGSGYNESASSFIGWVRQHEDVHNKMTYSSPLDLKNPLALKIKEVTQGIL